MRRLRLAFILLAAFALLAASGLTGWRVLGSNDPIDPRSGRPFELLPGLPRFDPGPDGEFETEDDVVDPSFSGDIDLVVRTGALDPPGNGGLPRIAGSDPPTVSAAPFGESSLPFHVLGWANGMNAGADFDGMPIVVTAFADLDDDGFIGVTLLDGDTSDEPFERAELVPVGRQVSVAQGVRAKGRLSIAAGGPPGAELRVLATAVAYIGSFDPGYFGGNVPDGPAVFTALPFLPRTSASRTINGGPSGPGPADPDALLAVEIEEEFEVDPTDPRYGEAFTLAADGTEWTLDGVDVSSGPFSHFGALRVPDPETYRASNMRPLRPGFDDAWVQTLYEVLRQLHVADDGPTGVTVIRIVPLDRLGNVTELPHPVVVQLRASGGVRIVAPSRDAEPQRESVIITDSRGVEVVLDDTGGELDDADEAVLLIQSGSVLDRLDVFVPDPDVDDSGLVDEADVRLLADLDHARIGDPDYDPRLDLDGDGRIDDDDVEVVQAAHGTAVPIP